MVQTQPELPLHDQILGVISRYTFPESDRAVLERAALALTPVDVQLMRDVAAYVGSAALVSDVVAALGLSHTKGVVVGKALARLGYKRTVIHQNGCPHPIWLKDCKLPKLELWKLLERVRLRELARLHGSQRESWDGG